MEATILVGDFILNNPGTTILAGLIGLVAVFWMSARKVKDGFDVG